jgi:hypothetical protein
MWLKPEIAGIRVQPIPSHGWFMALFFPHDSVYFEYITRFFAGDF